MKQVQKVTATVEIRLEGLEKCVPEVLFELVSKLEGHKTPTFLSTIGFGFVGTWTDPSQY